MNKSLKSPIKYYGGKGNGVREIIYGYFPSESSYDIYIEAFGGGANLLLYKERFGIEIYNDLEQNVYSLFKVISDKSLFYKFKELCDLAIYSRQLRDEYKEDLQKRSDMDIVERAFRYFYINRASFNGNGGFAVSASINGIRRGMSKSTSDFLSSIDGLWELHNRLSSVIIENMDGIELIKRHDKERVFMYLDPPYSYSTRSLARYKVDMSNEQQKELIDTLLGFKNAKVLISGYNCNEYKRLVSGGWEMVEFRVNTQDSDMKPKTKTEFLWKNYSGSSDSSSFSNCGALLELF